MTTDDIALEHLDTLAIALSNTIVNANGIANMGYTPMGYFFMQYATPAE